MERRLAEYEAQQEQIAKTEEFIRRFKAGQRSKEAKGREKRLKRLDRLHAPRNRETLKLESAGPPAQRAHGAGDRRPGGRLSAARCPIPPVARRATCVLARCPDLEIERGERVALIGPTARARLRCCARLSANCRPLRGQIDLGHNVARSLLRAGA